MGFTVELSDLITGSKPPPPPFRAVPVPDIWPSILLKDRCIPISMEENTRPERNQPDIDSLAFTSHGGKLSLPG